MDVYRLSDAIGEIDERFISSAINHKPKRRFRRYAVANFLLVMIIVGFNMTTLFRCGSDMKGDDAAPINIVEFGGACYEEVMTHDSDTLIRYDLPYEITDDMVGENLGSGKDPYGEKWGNIYVYEPYSHITTDDGRVCRSVYINENEGIYSYLLFCNPILFDSNTHTEFTELLSFYGIDEWKDVESLRIGERTYTAPSDIKRLFGIFTESLSMGNDDFDSFIYEGTDSSAPMDMISEMADTSMGIRIISEEGVIINDMTFYPTINHIHWAGSYFRLEEDVL